MAANWTRLIRITVWAAACCLAFMRGVPGELLPNVSVRHEGSHASLNVPLPEPLSIRNRWLTLTLRTAGGEMSVTDHRTGRRWGQQSGGPGLIALSASAGERLELVLLDVGSGLRITNRWMLEAEAPEIVTTLETEGELSDPVRFPYPFVTEAGTRLVVPLNEGIAYPVEDSTVETMRLIAYGGHGLCMAFWGVTDGEAGHLAILETPDDAAIRLRRRDGLLAVQPEWESQRGRWGYRRSLRYVFFDAGGHVAMAKRYRGYAKSIGRFKTLAEKRAENPNVDLLAGAANIWCWDRDAVSIVREMQAAGMDRILWSNRQEPEALDRLNELGVLTSRYDIYQDVMAPTNFPHLRGVHPDWVTEAWPQDVIRDARGRSLPGWEVRGTNGQWYPCGVVCDRRIPSYAAGRIPPELLTHPYRCRFIDTTTASPWRECYDPAHPMTRSESREWKMRLLATVCQELRLVTGCETGHDAAVPWVHYFEGMLSLGPYRVPDSGRDMQRIWTEVPDRVARFQLGHTYRLPLWELVYHDCVVAQWYWGDYNNKLPGLWEKRDLFNALYGTPPMYMLDRSRWTREKQRFVRSYLRATPVARATAYAEMTGHQHLTADRAVQQTTFANGVRVTVNFGEQPFRSSDAGEIPAAGLRVERMPVNQEPAGSQPGSVPPR